MSSGQNVCSSARCVLRVDSLSDFFFIGDSAALAWKHRKHERDHTQQSISLTLITDSDEFQQKRHLLDGRPVFKDVDVPQHVDDKRPWDTDGALFPSTQIILLFLSSCQVVC